MKIVSLLPSATEIVAALGLMDQLVGVTHECDYPEVVRTLPRVTRTLIPADAASAEIDLRVRDRLGDSRALYTLEWDVLERLSPDLIVTQALCDVCAVAESEVREAACRLTRAPQVLNLEPMTLADVFSTLHRVAESAGLPQRAEPVVAALRDRVAAVAARTAQVPEALRPGVLFLEWIDPPFSAGHWIPELIRLAGGIGVCDEGEGPSVRIAPQRFEAIHPDVVFIACCGFSTGRALEDVPLLKRIPGFAAWNARIFVTDGNAYFSRPGPRLVDGLEILAHALFPDRHPLPPGLVPAVSPGPAYLLKSN